MLPKKAHLHSVCVENLLMMMMIIIIIMMINNDHDKYKKLGEKNHNININKVNNCKQQDYLYQTHVSVITS